MKTLNMKPLTNKALAQYYLNKLLESYADELIENFPPETTIIDAIKKTNESVKADPAYARIRLLYKHFKQADDGFVGCVARYNEAHEIYLSNSK